MATLSCKCGKVIIQFPTAKPRCTTECCCDDCFERLNFLFKQGGPSIEHGIFMRTRPITIHWFDNRLEVMQGSKYLKFYKLRPSSGVINMASSCCNTFLAKENPRYQGNTVAVFEQDFGEHSYEDTANQYHQPRPVVHVHNIKNMKASKPFIRMFPNHWLHENVQFLHPLPHVWVNDTGDATGSPKDWETTFEEFMEKTSKPVRKNAPGMDFADLIACNGGNIEVASAKVLLNQEPSRSRDTKEAAIVTSG
mmetsp:Transcript_11942/g.17293  ORF Transcript_11942/g.17293 Transcript_11942/m.17293 type:complete len:251 (+) Transcript_11942:214-966(+)